MKRTCFFLITLLLLFAAIGSRDTIASLDRAMVHAIGIDKMDDQIHVTLQVFRPDAAGTDTQLDAGKANIFVISASAPTVEEAMTVCENRLGEFLFIGHVQLIVLGKGVDLGTPEHLFAYFLKSKESYMGLSVACTDGSAEELLSAKLSEGAVAAQNILNIIERHAVNSKTVSCDLLTALNSKDRSLAMPMLRLVKSSEESEEQEGSSSEGGEEEEPNLTVSAEGAKVFVDGRASFDLSADECAGLSLLRNESKRLSLRLDGRYGSSAVTVNTESRKLSLSRNGDSFTCRYDLTLSVLANQSTDSLFDRSQLGSSCEEGIRRLCEAAVSKCRDNSATDLLGGAKLIRYRYPQVWLDCGEDASEAEQLISYSISASCRLD